MKLGTESLPVALSWGIVAKLLQMHSRALSSNEKYTSKHDELSAEFEAFYINPDTDLWAPAASVFHTTPDPPAPPPISRLLASCWHHLFGLATCYFKRQAAINTSVQSWAQISMHSLLISPDGITTFGALLCYSLQVNPLTSPVPSIPRSLGNMLILLIFIQLGQYKNESTSYQVFKPHLNQMCLPPCWENPIISSAS